MVTLRSGGRSWQKLPVQSAVRHQRPSAARSDDEEEDDSEADSEEDDDSEESDEDETAVPTTADLKTVIYSSDGKTSLGFTLVGGNVKGVFVHTIDHDGAAANAGLSAGDYLLQAGYAFIGVSLSVCLFACSFVSRMTQKRLN